MLVAIDRHLAYTGLHFLIHVRIGKAKHQAVCPCLVYDTQLPYDGFIMIGIIETFHPYLVACIDVCRHRSVRLEVEYLHIGVHVIVVVRIVLESINLIREAILKGLSEVHIRLMRIKRAIRIRGIRKPAVALLLGDDIHHTSNGIRAKTDRYHAFIDFDTLGKVHRDIVQSKGTSHPFLRHAINKHLDMLSAEAVHHQLHVRTHAARLAKLHARRLRQRIAQALGRILKLLRIQCHGIECRALHTAYSV